MDCELCHNDPGEITVILPIRQPNGYPQTLACLDCSLQSDVYCLRHKRPHLGFEDDTTACVGCIDDSVHLNGERISGLFAGRIALSPNGQKTRDKLNNWYQLTYRLPGYPLEDLDPTQRIDHGSQSLAIARLIITRAKRMRLTPMEIINEVVATGPQIILPNLGNTIG